MFIFKASAGRLRSTALQAVVAAPVAVCWVGQEDVGNNVADAQWFLVYAAFWAALYQGADRRLRIAAVAVLFAAAASDPFTGLFLPLLWRRSRTGMAGMAGMAAGLAFQAIGVICMGSLSSRYGHRDYDVLNTAGFYLAQVVGRVLWPLPGFWLIGAVFSSGLLVGGLRFLPRSRRGLPITALAYSALIYLALVTEGGFPPAPRYAYLGTALLLAGIASAVVETGLGTAALTVAVAVCVCSGYFENQSLRNRGPSWRAQIQQAAARCESGHGADADVAIVPASWVVRIPCSLLVGAEPGAH